MNINFPATIQSIKNVIPCLQTVQKSWDRKTIDAGQDLVEWITAAEKPQALWAHQRIIHYFNNLTYRAFCKVTGHTTPSQWQTRCERSFTVAKRVAIVVGVTVALSGAGYLAGLGLAEVGMALKGTAAASTSFVAMPLSASATTLINVGQAMAYVSKGIFLSISVPLYGAGVVFPRWLAEMVLPKVVEVALAALATTHQWVLDPIMRAATHVVIRVVDIVQWAAVPVWSVIGPLADRAFQNIACAFAWVAGTILPITNAIVEGAWTVGRLLNWTVNTIISPVLNPVADATTWVAKNILFPIASAAWIVVKTVSSTIYVIGRVLKVSVVIAKIVAVQSLIARVLDATWL